MRKIILALAAVAAVGLAVPAFTATSAEARHVVVIKRHHMHRDHGHHYGWYKHRYHRNHWHRHHGPRVIIR
jgi:Ni/Co efflux regulator RcnB